MGYPQSLKTASVNQGVVVHGQVPVLFCWGVSTSPALRTRPGWAELLGRQPDAGPPVPPVECITKMLGAVRLPMRETLLAKALGNSECDL